MTSPAGHGLEPPAAFTAPWQLRIYAAAAAAADAGRLDRDVFLERFTAALEGAATGGDLDPDAAFRCWLTALEETLRASGVLSEADLHDALARQTAAGAGGDH